MRSAVIYFVLRGKTDISICGRHVPSATLLLHMPSGARLPSRIFVWPNRRLCLAQQKECFSPWLEGDAHEAHEEDGGRGADRSLVDAVGRIR